MSDRKALVAGMSNITILTKEQFEKKFSVEANSFSPEIIYILPEENNSNQCVLNEYTPEIKKLAKLKNFSCEVIYDKNNCDYLVLRDSQIILPFIVSLTASLCCDFLIYIISRKFEKEKNLKVRMFVMNDNENNVSEIVIEGDTESVLKTLEIIKKDKLEK